MATSLTKKLGIKSGYSILLHDEPVHYFELFVDFPEDVLVLDKIAPETADFIHLFFTTKEAMVREVPRYKKALKKDGLMWVSWPKGASKMETDLKREPVRDYLLGIGLVDVKVAAIDEDWSGLKFVYRVKDR
ncbi:MAG: DUF3052 domain-containing protein [Bacteroidia bacterium]